MGSGGARILVLVVFLLFASCREIDAQLDVTNFGAVGDGQTNDSPAFLKAWEALCQSTDQSPTLIIPTGKTFLLQALAFEGPCKAPSVHIQIDGNLLIPKKQDWSTTECVDQWMRFSHIDSLIVDGSGTIDGQGATWWGEDNRVKKFTRRNLGFDFNQYGWSGTIDDQSSTQWEENKQAKRFTGQNRGFDFNQDGSETIDDRGSTQWEENKRVNRFTGQNWGSNFNPDCERPTALRFHQCVDLRLSGLKVINGPRNHFSIVGCDGAVISSLHIEAPDESPNTDGIDISSSANTRIENSFIGTGDDCIAVNGGVKNLTVDNLLCGPGHGISIGSLGKNGRTETVEDVLVQNTKFTRVQNGARIKTWEGGAGYVKGITYKNITLDNAGQPIIIDQNYCPEHNCGPTKPSSVAISDVSFIDFSGTTSTLRTITLNCSSIGPGCTNTILSNIKITKGDIDRLYDEDRNRNVGRIYNEANDRDIGRLYDEENGRNIGRVYNEAGDRDNAGRLYDEENGRNIGRIYNEAHDRDNGRLYDEEHGRNIGRVYNEAGNRDNDRLYDEEKGRNIGRVYNEAGDRYIGRVYDEEKGRNIGRVYNEAGDRNIGRVYDEENGRNIGRVYNEAGDRDIGRFYDEENGPNIGRVYNEAGDRDIGRLYDEHDDGEVYAYCKNVHGKATETIPVVSCLE